MDQERIHAEIEARRRPGLVVQRLGGLKGMASMLAGRPVPRQIRTLVEEAFSANAYMRPSIIDQKRGEIGELFREYSQADWKRAIEALLPQVAPSAESAWQVLAKRPYQYGLTVAGSIPRQRHRRWR
jgi:hypothetical protein